MAKIVDPILDYFFQIPLAEGNILQFLSHHGFRVSKVQNPDGSTKTLIFYHVSYPSKTVQFQDDGTGIENFLYASQQNLFLVLDEKELTFIFKTPRLETGIAIQKGDSNMNFPVRQVRFTGEEPNISQFSEGETEINLSKNLNTFVLPHENIQKIFINFIENKRLMDLSELPKQK